MAAFTPNSGEIIVGAFARLMIRRTELTVTHLSDARHEANLLQAQWGNRGPNLWTVDQQEIALQPNVSTYRMPLDTIDVLDAYLSLGSLGSDAGPDAGLDGNAGIFGSFDRELTALGRSEYLDQPNKNATGLPTSFWYRRADFPMISFWPVPNAALTMFFWRTRQINTVSVSGGATPEIPYLWIDAFTAGLAHRLSRIYAPAMEGIRKADASEAWQIAADQDTEKTPLSISPDVGRYYR